MLGKFSCKILDEIQNGHPDLRFVKKKLHAQIFGPQILHTKSANIVTILTQKETA